jgi:hypothetical protein
VLGDHQSVSQLPVLLAATFMLKGGARTDTHATHDRHLQVCAPKWVTPIARKSRHSTLASIAIEEEENQGEGPARLSTWERVKSGILRPQSSQRLSASRLRQHTLASATSVGSDPDRPSLVPGFGLSFKPRVSYPHPRQSTSFDLGPAPSGPFDWATLADVPSTEMKPEDVRGDIEAGAGLTSHNSLDTPAHFTSSHVLESGVYRPCRMVGGCLQQSDLFWPVLITYVSVSRLPGLRPKHGPEASCAHVQLHHVSALETMEAQSEYATGSEL